MKDTDGYKPFGWMMHPPFSLPNGTPLLAVYAYLYHTARKQPWRGSVAALAEYLEINTKTVRRCVALLQSRNLCVLTPVTNGVYEITLGQIVHQQGQNVSQQGQIVPPIYNYNNNYIPNKSNIISSHSVCVNETGKPTHTHSSSRFIAPTWEEFSEYARRKNIASDIAKSFYAYWESRDWKRESGYYVSNWQAQLGFWVLTVQERQKQLAAKTATSWQAGQQMSPQNRLIFEQEKQRKAAEKAAAEAEEKISYEEWKQRNQK